jgi:hypothetical protein
MEINLHLTSHKLWQIQQTLQVMEKNKSKNLLVSLENTLKNIEMPKRRQQMQCCKKKKRQNNV